MIKSGINIDKKNTHSIHPTQNIINNGIVGIVCIILYFVLRKKSVFIKYAEGYKHVLSIVLKYFLIVYGSISLVFSIILAVLNFC